MKLDSHQFDKTWVHAFYDKDTATLTYVVTHEDSKEAIVIDPVLNFDVQSGRTWTDSTEELVSFFKKESLTCKLIVETHAHADHLTGAGELKKHFPSAQVAISENIKEVQTIFNEELELGIECDGSQFDLLLKDGQSYEVGPVEFQVRATPGHTPACLSLNFGSFLFSGDALFMPDYGTGRCDFPAGSSRKLYQSIVNQIYSLSDETTIFVGHDYCPGGRELAYFTTVGQSKKENVRLKESVSEDDFIEFRDSRDMTLKTPKLLYPSIQFNINAGKPAKRLDNGKAYFVLPLSSL